MSKKNNIDKQLSSIKNILIKQNLVENPFQRQEMSRKDIIESHIQKQNSTELEKFFKKLEVNDIAKILESLMEEERAVVWDHIDISRRDDVLLEVSDDIRMELVSDDAPNKEQITVIRVFDLFKGRLRQIPIYNRKDLEKARPIWVDLVTPEIEQLEWAREIFGAHIPNPNELTDLETSARFYIEDNGEIHLHSNFLLDSTKESKNVTVAFVLKDKILFTVRNEELPVFRLQRLRARAEAGYVSQAKDVLLDLYAADIEYSANALEDVYSRLEKVGKQVVRSYMTNSQAATILSDIAIEEDLNGKIRRNVMDTRNALSFLMRSKLLSVSQHEDVKEILRDIDSLDGHTSFLFNKINFQMDATVGFLNVNQNIDLKRLTIISLVFMPVNIIAGIGGMSEFSMMTSGIPWQLAYGCFVLAMIAIGLFTFIGLRTLENKRIEKLRSENFSDK
ncbi:MAG: magnesium transporter CorA [Betaproteobacteria bacterium]|nr:magnesium transporter CorA [Betaproteobacteria bacterium]